MREKLFNDKERARAGAGRGSLRQGSAVTPSKKERKGKKLIGRKSLKPHCGSEKVMSQQIGLTSPSYLVRNRTLGPPLEHSPEIPPSSREEGLRLLHGLATNLATSLQTPQEA